VKNNVLWLIPARSGSKGIPDKNIRKLNGIPLLAYRIKTAISISDPQNVWISTDSPEYGKIAMSYGARMPFLRPDDLASDHASSMDVVLHAMEYAKNLGQKFEFIGLLEPTSPFVYYQDILKAIKKLQTNKEATSVVAVRESKPNSFFVQEEAEYLNILGDRIRRAASLGRQFFKREITPSGGFYISKWDDFFIEKTFYTSKTLPYELNEGSSLEIDEMMDWHWAEFLLKDKIIDIHKIYK